MANNKRPKRRRGRARATYVGFGDVRPADIEGAFTGEMMTCVMCGAQERSDPDVNSEWRMIMADSEKYYACPDEFPPDDAGKVAFTEAYETILRRIIKLRRFRFTRPRLN